MKTQRKRIRCVLLPMIVATMLAACTGTNMHDTDTTGGAHIHNFGEWVVTAPTCTADGACVRFCDCGEKESEKISALGHDYVDGFCIACGEQEPAGALALTLNADGNGYCVSGLGSCNDEKIVIPDTYRGLPVTMVGYSAFRNCATIVSVTVSQGISVIDNDAFGQCTALTTLTLPNSLTFIGRFALYGCTSLTDIYFDGTRAQWDAIEKGEDWDANTGEYVLHCTDGVQAVVPVLKADYGTILLSGNDAIFDVLSAMENADRLDAEKLVLTSADEQIVRVDGTLVYPVGNSEDGVTVTVCYENTVLTVLIRTEKVADYRLVPTKLELSVGDSADITLLDRYRNAVTELKWEVTEDFFLFCEVKQTQRGLRVTALAPTVHETTGNYVSVTVRDPAGKRYTCKIYISHSEE